jgi:predicted Zn-ribbon and HTH transcriptional regulator
MGLTMQNQEIFTNRVGVLATKHHKEQVIAPILEQELGIKVTVPPDFDTDAFGTFTREIKRLGTQIEAARLKAEKVLEMTGETLALASEGSFAPHPSLPYISANREIVILLDKQHDLEIIGEVFSAETNHNHKVVKSLEEAFTFAKKVGFPSHGLVVMFNDSPLNSSEIIKGITTNEKLEAAVNFILKNSPNSTAHIETDMRALYNPTRMKNIAKATLDLARKINSRCPKCAAPGFDIVERKIGLPCALCHLPTRITRSVVYKCQKCNFSQEQLFPDRQEFADPAQCMYCNP